MEVAIHAVMQTMICRLQLHQAVTVGCTPMRKGWKIVTTHRWLSQLLQRTFKCPKHTKHGRCEGTNTKLSARCTTEYAKLVARALMHEHTMFTVQQELQGKTVLPDGFGDGATCYCPEPHTQKHGRFCGFCVQGTAEGSVQGCNRSPRQGIGGLPKRLTAYSASTGADCIRAPRGS